MIHIYSQEAPYTHAGLTIVRRIDSRKVMTLPPDMVTNLRTRELGLKMDPKRMYNYSTYSNDTLEWFFKA
jgi:hypothetical protein